MEEITVALFVKLVRLLVGILSFIGLLSLDLWKAWKSKAHWVPQGALVLSAFSIQLLDLLDTDNVSISDYPASKEYDLERVLRNGLLIDGGRVMVCVYMGYLLPEMARLPSKKVVWGDIGALALSLSTHIFSELYVFNELYWNLKVNNIPVNKLSIASRLCTGVCSMLLFFLLASAAFAGRTLHNLVWEKIPFIVRKEPEGYPTKSYSPKYVEDDVFLSWVVAWVCKPDYLIVRSVLASSVGVVVTVSVGCFAAEWTTQDYTVLHVGDGIDWFRHTVTAFMALLILIGWGIVVWRWMFAICYFPSKYKIPNKGYLHVEDFWTRHIFEVMDDIEFPRPSWDQQVSGGGFLENLKLRFLRAIKAHDLLRDPLLRLQRCIIWFSKLCCFLSPKILTKIFFVICKICSCTVGAKDYDFAGLEEALEKLVMPGETKESLLAASVKALKETKDFMEKGYIEGTKSESLIHLLRTKSTDQNSEGEEFMDTLRERLSRDVRFDYLTKFSWKMTALSLVRVIIELDARGADDAVDAYSQAYDFLDLLDNPAGTDKTFLPELFVRAADKQFIVIKQQLNRNKEPSPEETAIMKAAHQKIRRLQESSRSFISCNPNDSADWWEIAWNNSLDKVCKIILQNDALDGTNLLNMVRGLLAEMLAIALTKEVGIALVNNCREWAEMVNDEKIKASVYIAGKLKGVITKHGGVITDGNVGSVNAADAFNMGA